MSDLVKDINYLRYYYTSDDMLKEKDLQKNISFDKYQVRVQALFAIPLAF
jgi:hypothetical protein